MPWVLTKFEVAARSRTPESRPANDMTSRFVTRPSLLFPQPQVVTTVIRILFDYLCK
jgi:hypothetical protein